MACPPSCTWTCSTVTFCWLALPFSFCMASSCSLKIRMSRVARYTFASMPSKVWLSNVARLRNIRAASLAAIICVASMADLEQFNLAQFDVAAFPLTEAGMMDLRAFLYDRLAHVQPLASRD